jgi:O-antigen ligase
MPVVLGLSGLGLAVLLLSGLGDSWMLPALGLLALATVMLFAGMKSLRRFVVFAFFLTAALDINKALMPPLERFYSPGLYITLAQALMLAWGLLWLVERRAVRLPVSSLDRWALVYLAWIWFCALRSPAGSLALASAMAYSLCVLSYYLVSHAITRVEDLRLLLKAVLITFALQAAFTALQMALKAPIVLPGIKVAGLGGAMTLALGESSAFRPIGLFNHPNVMADYVLWLLLPAFALVLMGTQRIAKRVWWTALAVLLVAAGMLLASLSRGGWAAGILGGLVIGATYWRLRLIGRSHLMIAVGLVIVALVVVAVVYPQVFLRLTESDARSTESRLLLNDQAFMIIRDNWLTGAGFGAYNQAAYDHIPASWSAISEDYHRPLLMLVVHNHYLLVAAELGLPAMLFWVVLLCRFARQAWPLAQWPEPGLMALGVGLGGAMVAHMLYLASDNYYVDIRVFLLWTCAGLLQALTGIAQRQGAASRAAVRGAA